MLTSDLKNSAASPRSDSRSAAFELPAVVFLLTALVVIAGFWFFRQGFILYYGDAQAHLNISRGIVDSRTPGYDQLGTVWLPVLHVICLPFVRNDRLWSTGLAGTIPVALCFVIAGTAFFAAAREVYGNLPAAAVVVACFAINPNVLYLATIPMTEIVFLAGVAVLLLCAIKFENAKKRSWFALGIVSCWFISLTRYDGWFLIPFAAAWFARAAGRRTLFYFAVFAALAVVAPLYWMAHNWYETGNALDFYNGPYAPLAIQKHETYPGYRDWLAALHYYGVAARLCSGLPLMLLGLVGIAGAVSHRCLRPVLFLSLTPVFYLWSMHSSGGTPIHVPSLWPHSYYNTRYGIAVVPLCAFSAGAISRLLKHSLKAWVFAVPLIAVSPWLLRPSHENWITWKESQRNSDSRRIWTAEAANFLAAHYHSGQGILSSSGDVPGIYCKARIHLSETLNIGNGAAWMAAMLRPDLFHPSVWSIAQQDDLLLKSLRVPQTPVYDTRLQIHTKDDPTLYIFSRTGQ